VSLDKDEEKLYRNMRHRYLLVGHFWGSKDHDNADKRRLQYSFGEDLIILQVALAVLDKRHLDSGQKHPLDISHT